MPQSEWSRLLGVAEKVQQEVDSQLGPPPDGTLKSSSTVLPTSHFLRRGYLLQVARQINVSYENACYDAAAVLIRRLIESLLIEVYESKSRLQEVTDANGNLKTLEEIIKHAIGQDGLVLGRDAKKALTPLKVLGDRSAHNRKMNAHRTDIDMVRSDLRVVTEELLHLANLHPSSV